MRIQKDVVLSEKRDGILIITLNRPEKRNSLHPDLTSKLLDIFSKSKVDNEIFAVIITGAGSSFCAGADLAYLKSLRNCTYEEHLADSRHLKDMYYEIYCFPKPVIALINGAAVAGGCGLMSVCDYRIAAASAVFGYPEVKIGFTAAIVSVFLKQLIGLGLCKELLLSGERFSSQRALEIGLISGVVRDDDLVTSGFKLVEQLKQNSPSSLVTTKELLIDKKEINRQLDEACIINAQSRMLPDFKEGIDSFLQKRKAEWGSRET